MRRRYGGASRPGEPPAPLGQRVSCPLRERPRLSQPNGHPARCYGLAHYTPEPEIVAHLFMLYAEKVKA